MKTGKGSCLGQVASSNLINGVGHQSASYADFPLMTSLLFIRR